VPASWSGTVRLPDDFPYPKTRKFGSKAQQAGACVRSGCYCARRPASSEVVALRQQDSLPASPSRIAFTGPFNAGHHTRALDALCERLDAGARDIL